MTTPTGTNNLNALGVFFQRSLYRSEVYPDSLPDPIDMWYEKPLYGKLNVIDNPVFLSEAALKQLKTTDKKKMVMALNFVVDAFEDFRTFIERSIKQGKINVNDSILSDVIPKTGWTSVNTSHQAHVSMLYEVFRDVFVKEFNRDQRISDFPSFLKVFLEYIDLLNPAFPFTRSTFITTKFNALETTGLMISIREDNHAIDRKKFEQFIQDRNFEFYTKVARQHGFLVDKNAPWRLVADLGSPGMLPYMRKYGVELKTLFQTFYYEAYRTELEVLKVYVTQFYNSYVFSQPFQTITKFSPASGRLITERIERKTVAPTDYDELFWLRLYAYIHARETNTEFSQGGFDRLVRNASEILKNLDKVKSIDYVNRHLNGILLLSTDERGDNIRQIISGQEPRRTDFSF